VTHHFDTVPVARTFRQRFRGLIGKRDLFLFIPHCSSVHTFFMRAPIDVVFLDAKHTVIDIRHSVRPWRIAIGARASKHVLELPAGHARRIAVGDVVIDSASG
jgi:uncharacterized protein